MKTHGIIKILLLSFLLGAWTNAHSQYRMEVPGDNFSLEGALELFKKSTSPQEFEHMLNDPKYKVNNLDLNLDGYIDYIKVLNMKDGNVYIFIMQVVISEFENQDVAVITLKKKSNGKAVLQIIGDEDIYGVETILEPTMEVYTNAGYSSSRVVVNVWSWPAVQYIYSPYYTVWVSPWSWRYRPHWYHPWRPVVYYDYYAYWRPFRHHYTVCNTYRVVHVHKIYRPHRTTSVIVHKKYNDQIVHYRTSRIDRNGRYTSRRDHNDDRRIQTSVRYDVNGRIRTSTDKRVRSSRSSSYNQTREGRSYDHKRTNTSNRTYSSNGRPSDSRFNTDENKSRPSSKQRSTTYNRSSDRAEKSIDSRQRSSSSAGKERSTSAQRSTTQRYENKSTNNQAPNRSMSRSSNSNRQSSTSTNVQRSSNKPSKPTTYQRSSRSSNVQSSKPSSNVSRSSQRSSPQRSSSSGSTVRKSSSGSNVKQSSRSSSSQRSKSSSSSGSSRSSRSGSSENKGKGRH